MNSIVESINESAEKVNNHLSQNWKKILGVTILAVTAYILFNIYYLKQPVGIIDSSFTNNDKRVSFTDPPVSESLTPEPTTPEPKAFTTTPPPYTLESDFEDYVRKHEEKHANQYGLRNIFG